MTVEASVVCERLDCRNVADELGIDFQHRRGTWWPCRCPMPGHDDSDPSASIGPRGWRCHGCGASGDILDLYRVTTGDGFPRAVEALAGMAGLEGADERNASRRMSTRPRPERAHNEEPDVEPVAAHRAREVLRTLWKRLQLSNVAAEYLEGRGISSALARREGLRSATPTDWHSFRAAFDSDELAAAGLYNPDGDALHPFWWWAGECLVLPFYDADAEIVSLRFRRIFDDASPKVLGLRSTPTGLHRLQLPFGAPEHVQLAQHGDVPLYVVEGELDALSLWCIGRRAVAAPGANNWPDNWCKSWTDVPAVVVLADGDEAGTRLARGVAHSAVRTQGVEWMANRLHTMAFPNGADANDLLVSGELACEIRKLEERIGCPAPSTPGNAETQKTGQTYREVNPLDSSALPGTPPGDVAPVDTTPADIANTVAHWPDPIRSKWRDLTEQYATKGHPDDGPEAEPLSRAVAAATALLELRTEAVRPEPPDPPDAGGAVYRYAANGGWTILNDGEPFDGARTVSRRNGDPEAIAELRAALEDLEELPGTDVDESRRCYTPGRRVVRALAYKTDEGPGSEYAARRLIHNQLGWNVEDVRREHRRLQESSAPTGTRPAGAKSLERETLPSEVLRW